LDLLLFCSDSSLSCRRVHGIQGRLQLFQEILRVLGKRSRARLHNEFRDALCIEAFLFQLPPYLQ
jgi:hypothetical protein